MNLSSLWVIIHVFYYYLLAIEQSLGQHFKYVVRSRSYTSTRGTE